MVQEQAEVREAEQQQYEPLLMVQLQGCEIAAMDVKKLKDAGFVTVEAVARAAKKELVAIKGLSDVKVDKITEAGTHGIHQRAADVRAASGADPNYHGCQGAG
jgi:hypothetical protein